MIASNTSLNYRQVNVWFLNRRLNQIKQHNNNNNNNNNSLNVHKSKQPLLNEFNYNKYPNRNTVDRLSKETNLSSKKVYNWFKSKRATLNINKRIRNVISNEVNSILLNEFRINNRPNKKKVNELAVKSSMTHKQVQKWFSNKRSALNIKKRNKKSVISNEVNSNLLKEFKINKYPDTSKCERLALETNLSRKSVFDWFNSKRSDFNSKQRKRSVISDEVKLILLNEFQINQYPNKQKINELALKSNMTYKHIYCWFCNKRSTSNIENLKKTSKLTENKKIKFYFNSSRN
jgi:hypothetical protein